MEYYTEIFKEDAELNSEVLNDLDLIAPNIEVTEDEDNISLLRGGCSIKKTELQDQVTFLQIYCILMVRA